MLATPIVQSTEQVKMVYVCTGSDCRKHKKAFKSLLGALSPRAEVCEVKCQKICSGPVVGVEINGQIEWFRKLKDQALHTQLFEFLRDGTISRSLKSQVVKARRGKLRIKKKINKAA